MRSPESALQLVLAGCWPEEGAEAARCLFRHHFCATAFVVKSRFALSDLDLLLLPLTGLYHLDDLGHCHCQKVNQVQDQDQPDHHPPNRLFA